MSRSSRLAFVSIDPTWEEPEAEAVAFPYGVRKLEASIRSCPDLDDVETCVIDLRSRDAEEFLQRIVAFRPTIVAASLYVWSIGIFTELASLIRRWDPSVRILVGGPHARASVFALAPYGDLARSVDAAVTGEGEEIIRRVVREHHSDNWTKMPGLLVPSPFGWRSTGAIDRPVLDDYPSPYQLDLAPVGSTGYFETFRGCPIHCTFCQWGEQRADRVHSVEYLVEHLRGIERARVPDLFCLDAAFNLSPRALRNLVEAEAQVGVLSRSMVHGHLYPTFLKDEQLEFIASFGRAQVSIGIQSFNPEVLHRLGRPFDLERFERVLDAVRGVVPIELELMLGLPGDDPASFRATFERAVDLADTLRVFKTLVLPDALMDRAGPGMDIDFDPETFLIRSCRGWSPEELERELDHVKTVAMQHERAIIADTWAGFCTRREEPGRRGFTGGIDSALEVGVDPVPIETIERLRQAVGGVGGWHLRTVRNQIDGLFFDLDSPGGRVVLEAIALDPSVPRFETRDGVAYSHRGKVERDGVAGLRRVIEIVHSDTVPLVNRVS